MKLIPNNEFEKAAGNFMADTYAADSSAGRERSWDFCYSYFQENQHPTDAMDMSCLHLWSYLGSWGMLRGSSWLFKNANALHLKSAVDVIEKYNPHLQGWDLDEYDNPEKVATFLAAWDELRAALLPQRSSHVILVSKVIMGVWGCFPALDTYFVATFKGLAENREESRAFSTPSAMTFELLEKVYTDHRDEIERVRSEHRVWDMKTGEATDRLIPRAKVLDMYGFYESWSKA